MGKTNQQTQLGGPTLSLWLDHGVYGIDCLDVSHYFITGNDFAIGVYKTSPNWSPKLWLMIVTYNYNWAINQLITGVKFPFEGLHMFVSIFLVLLFFPWDGWFWFIWFSYCQSKMLLELTSLLVGFILSCFHAIAVQSPHVPCGGFQVCTLLKFHITIEHHRSWTW